MPEQLVETPEERQRRYKRLAIAAAVAAARAPLDGVRTAYLLLAESWSNLADPNDIDASVRAKEPPSPSSKDSAER